MGFKSTAARTAIEQMRTHRTTLMYLGVPIIGPSILFGDNKSVVNTTSHPHGKFKLHKRHLMLSYHYVREALATGEYVYSFVNTVRRMHQIYSASTGTTKTTIPILILSSHYYFMVGIH